MKIEGVLTAIVTPFTHEGGLDLSALDRIVDRQIEAGVSGIVVAGTTGEGSSLSDDEREALFLRVKDRVDGRVHSEPYAAGDRVDDLRGSGEGDRRDECEQPAGPARRKAADCIERKGHVGPGQFPPASSSRVENIFRWIFASMSIVSITTSVRVSSRRSSIV